MTTWRRMIQQVMTSNGDSFDNQVHLALGPNEDWNWRHEDRDMSSQISLDAEFDSSFGGTNGCYFTLWTKEYVYFPCESDGSEHVSYVPRNPCDKAIHHVGG